MSSYAQQMLNSLSPGTRARVEQDLAALWAERRRLIEIEHDAYSPDDVRGSLAWEAHNRACLRLELFDLNHPEVAAAALKPASDL